MEQNNKLVLFQEKQIRREWYNNEWYFSIIDVIEVLTESLNPRRYWSDLKRKLAKEGYNQLYEKIVQLKMAAPDGRLRDTDTANDETLFRLIMSVTSPKAEPFKLWLAQVGKQHIAEIENPELAADRARDLYKAKGYSEEWINYRLKSIGIRQELTAEWKDRGVKEGHEYAILTAEISKATFGLTPSEYKEVKSLNRQNLRDHMTNLELIFTMLGEESTRRYAVKNDAQGFEENRQAALEGGEAAGAALENFEKKTGEKVVVSDNFLNQIDGTTSNKLD